MRAERIAVAAVVGTITFGIGYSGSVAAQQGGGRAALTRLASNNIGSRRPLVNTCPDG